jgi:hypothetical protein
MKHSVLRACLSLLPALPLVGQAELADEFKSYDDLNRGRPVDVSGLLARIGGCNHWSGEEP